MTMEVLENHFRKERQIALLQRFVSEKLEETLLGDILSDSMEMLTKQLDSDFAWGDFKNYAEEIDQLKKDMISLQREKNHLLIENESLESENNKLRMYSSGAREDIEKLKLRLERVLKS